MGWVCDVQRIIEIQGRGGEEGMSKPFCGCTECDRSHCSDMCRYNWHIELERRRQRIKRAERVLFAEIKECGICGKLFIGKNSRQRFCQPECSHRALRMRYRVNYIATWWKTEPSNPAGNKQDI